MKRYLAAGSALLLLVLIGTLAGLVSSNNKYSFGNDQAAIIQLDGTISGTAATGFNPQGITPQKVRELNSEADSRGADAIIYEWNSGGGSVVASKEIKREIESVEKPTVCRFRDVAASGAYMASLGCDKIVADSASLTGSIGVRSSYLEFSGLMDKLGVEYVNITSGELKGMGSPYRNATEEEIESLQNKSDIIHKQFVSDVRETRNLTENETREVRTGEIFLGSQAQELGLVDSLGGRKHAMSVAENMTDSDLQGFKVETQPSFSLLSLLGAESFFQPLVSDQTPIKADWR